MSFLEHGSKLRLFKGMRLADKRILITGADGFIGSHVAEALVGLRFVEGGITEGSNDGRVA